jgi:hypothetical protein
MVELLGPVVQSVIFYHLFLQNEISSDHICFFCNLLTVKPVPYADA